MQLFIRNIFFKLIIYNVTRLAAYNKKFWCNNDRMLKRDKMCDRIYTLFSSIWPTPMKMYVQIMQVSSYDLQLCVKKKNVFLG